MAKKQDTALSRFMQFVEIKDPDSGEVVRVPVNLLENRTANQLVAARMRGLINDTITAYKAKDATLMPKELKDLCDAAAKLAEFSGAVYKDEDDLNEKKGEKPVEKTEPAADDFSTLVHENPAGQGNPQTPS